MIACQVLDALCRKGDPALDTVGEFLKDVRLTEVTGLSNELAGYYRFRSMEDYYHFLFLRMIESGTRVARCECCGRFFIPRTRAATKYCDRVIRDGRTCKQLAPALKHQRQAEHDKVIGACDRVKRKLYKRVARSYELSGERSKMDMGYQEYYAWLDAAQAARNDYLAGKLTAEQALAVIAADSLKTDAAQ